MKRKTPQEQKKEEKKSKNPSVWELLRRAQSLGLKFPRI